MIPERWVSFVRLPSFERSASGILTEEEIRLLEVYLARRPGAAVVIPGTGGVRKVRWGTGRTGKRGGARILYLPVARAGRIYLLLAYTKGDQADLAPEQKRLIRDLVARLEEEIDDE